MTTPDMPPGLNGEQAQQVMPFPVPLSWQFGKAQTPAGTFLAVIIHDPTGTKCVFMDRDSAMTFFEQGLLQTQSLIGSGIIIPNVRPPGDLRG